MPTHMLTAYLAIAIAMTLGILVTDRARRTLTPDQKLEVLEGLSPFWKYVFVPFIAFIFVVYERPVLSWIIWGFALCIASFYILKSVAVRRANVPDSYRRACSIEARIAFVGLMAFLAAGFWPKYGA